VDGALFNEGEPVRAAGAGEEAATGVGEEIWAAGGVAVRPRAGELGAESLASPESVDDLRDGLGEELDVDRPLEGKGGVVDQEAFSTWTVELEGAGVGCCIGWPPDWRCAVASATAWSKLALYISAAFVLYLAGPRLVS